MKMCSNQKVEENNSFKIKFYKRKELPVKDFEQNMCSPAFLPYPTQYPGSVVPLAMFIFSVKTEQVHATSTSVTGRPGNLPTAAAAAGAFDHL